MPIRKISQLILAIALILGTLGALPADLTAPTRAHPMLLEMARTEPGRMVRIIAQAAPGADGAAGLVSKLGGQVTNELSLIHAVTAEMSAKSAVELSRSDAIRWVSLDAPVKSSVAQNTYLTWATDIGYQVANSFTDSASVVDSMFGPNGTFGGGGAVNAAFGGFSLEANPGFAITKVELVFNAYVTKKLDSVNQPSYRVCVDYVCSSPTTLDPNSFENLVGSANAGEMILDLTSIRDWQWADFEKVLEVVVDQTNFNDKDYIYYDAIGLQVTSSPGVDNSLDAIVAQPVSMDTLLYSTASESSATYATDAYARWIDTSQQLNVYAQTIGASELWNAYNSLQGDGIGVAVVDSGITKLKEYKVKSKVNFNQSYHNSADRYGHGTFVAGIIAGNGKTSGGMYIGVAPKTPLHNVRVADDTGMMYISDVVEALQWVYENKDTRNIRVVNLSLNQSVPESYHVSPLDAAVEILWFNGVVVVVSAGNNGTTTLYPPANDPFVITVGATDDGGTISLADDIVTNFSAYGVTEDGFSKPELVAPGRNIIGLLPENHKLTMGQAHPENQVDQTHFKMSGTSVSAPMVSGAIALLLQAEPNLTPDQVKYRLMSTANRDWGGYDAVKAGAGYLDIGAAVYTYTSDSANTGTLPSDLLYTGDDPIAWGSVGWNSVGWNSVGWNSVGWNSVGWNSVGWNSVGWNSDIWDN